MATKAQLLQRARKAGASIGQINTVLKAQAGKPGLQGLIGALNKQNGKGKRKGFQSSGGA